MKPLAIKLTIISIILAVTGAVTFQVPPHLPLLGFNFSTLPIKLSLVVGALFLITALFILGIGHIEYLKSLKTKSVKFFNKLYAFSFVAMFGSLILILIIWLSMKLATFAERASVQVLYFVIYSIFVLLTIITILYIAHKWKHYKKGKK